jgi:hypothetical protein
VTVEWEFPVLNAVIGWFKTKRKLVAVIIDKSRGFDTVQVDMKEGDTFSVKSGGEEHRYDIDPEANQQHDKKRYSLAVYFKGNPGPIRFHFQEPEKMDTTGYNRLLKHHFIRELFSPEGLSSLLILMALVGVSILLSIFILLIQYGVIKPNGAP